MTKPIIERAFDIAGEGGCRNWKEVAKRLSGEGYATIDGHFQGRSLKMEINAICAKAYR